MNFDVYVYKKIINLKIYKYSCKIVSLTKLCKILIFRNKKIVSSDKKYSFEYIKYNTNFNL